MCGSLGPFDRGIASVETTIFTPNGRLFVRESQYATEGGAFVARTADGFIRRKRLNRQYHWIYRDSAPGSTDIYGPAVNARRPTSVFRRIKFGSPRNAMVDGEGCMPGVGSDERLS